MTLEGEIWRQVLEQIARTHLIMELLSFFFLPLSFSSFIPSLAEGNGRNVRIRLLEREKKVFCFD